MIHKGKLCLISLSLSISTSLFSQQTTFRRSLTPNVTSIETLAMAANLESAHSTQIPGIKKPKVPCAFPGADKLKEKSWEIHFLPFDEETCNTMSTNPDKTYFILVSIKHCHACDALKDMLQQGSTKGKPITIYELKYPIAEDIRKQLALPKINGYPQLWAYKNMKPVSKMVGFYQDKVTGFMEKAMK